MGELRYAFADSPLGTLLAATRDGALVRLAFEYEDADAVLTDLEEDLRLRARESTRQLGALRRELGEYFAGRRRRFETGFDLSLVDGFTRRVLQATARIPYGSVSTYGEVASAALSPRAGRAAGNALHHNPVPILVPCHRVIRTGGALGGYGGHEADKTFLLDLESGRP